jgi:hypothetical protein
MPDQIAWCRTKFSGDSIGNRSCCDAAWLSASDVSKDAAVRGHGELGQLRRFS